MSSLVCTHCGCSEIDTDPARGDAVCTQCGSVLEDQIIISEVQFSENAMGGASIVGQYVSADGPKSMGLGGGFHHGVGKESRQITLENGKTRIQRLGAQLKLNQHCIDTAFNFFKMAVNRRLTRGRRTNHVIAACVYIVCRTEGTSHMLLDFSDVLQIDVYTLGRTYLQLTKELCISIPALDPCLYIHRFAHKLEFEDKTHEVSMTALRLVQRMKRDWMAQGRRPSGLCGAALLVAARVHDFNRKIKDIIRVVKIGEGTIRKRLAEFEATPSSQLTIDEFQKIDLEEEMDPPCFTEGKRKAKLQQLEDQGLMGSITVEISELQGEIDKAIEEANKKKFARYQKYMDTGDTTSEASTSRVPSPMFVLDQPGNSCEVKSFLVSETLKDVISETTLNHLASNSKSLQILNSKDMISSTDENSSDGSVLKNSDNCDSLQKTQDKNSDFGDNISRVKRPSAASLGIMNSIEDYMTPTAETEDANGAEEEDGELDLTGIDDSELETMILNDEEVKIKTSMWMKANADYLQEQKEKHEREEREREEELSKPDHKKKKRTRKKKPAKVEHSTAADAIKKMLQEKKISSKINYDVLKDLNKTCESVAGKSAGDDAVFGVGPIEITPLSITSRFKRPGDPSIKVEEGTKKVKMEEDFVKKEEEAVEPEVIIESGPVILESGPVDYGHEDEEEEYEEEEEHISAAALLGHGNIDAEEEYHDYGYEED